jgi:hypothetical protein
MIRVLEECRATEEPIERPRRYERSPVTLKRGRKVSVIVERER